MDLLNVSGNVAAVFIFALQCLQLLAFLSISQSIHFTIFTSQELDRLFSTQIMIRIHITYRISRKLYHNLRSRTYCGVCNGLTWKQRHPPPEIYATNISMMSSHLLSDSKQITFINKSTLIIKLTIVLSGAKANQIILV